jgi:FtsH-binding integral membrane protein
MSYYEMDMPLAAQAERSERAAFIRRTYAHLAGAVLAFLAIEAAIFSMFPLDSIHNAIGTLFQSPVTILLVFAAFIGSGFVARWWAHGSTSPAIQYAGLALYVAVQALFFVPLLYVAYRYTGDSTIIPTAGILTLCVFGGLTMAVFTTGKDFSFLGPILSLAGFILLGVIVAAIFFPIGLGLGFSFIMVAFASAYILYDTSNVLHHYRTDQHVGAALELFASLALLFYYILRILIATSSRD